MRVPFIARWPGTIPAGSVGREPAMTIDLLPTIAKIAGAELPKHPIDGRDIGPLLRAEPGARSPQEAYYFYWGAALEAVRAGKWKLHFPHGYRTIVDQPPGKDGQPGPYGQAKTALALFDLERDPAETTDRASANPEVVMRLETLAEKARAELGDSATRRTGAGVRPPGRLTTAD